MNTKEMILNEALKQFSEKGYAGTSMSDIAKPLGISKAALYKHFKNKQQIFDLIIEEAHKKYDPLLDSLFMHFTTGKTGEEDVAAYAGITAEKLRDRVLKLVSFTMKDPYSKQVRHMLTLSQFQSRELGAMYTQRYVETMLEHDEKLFEELMKQGLIKKDDPKQTALYFYAPVIMYMGIWDREPEREDECIAAIGRHVDHFFQTVRA